MVSEETNEYGCPLRNQTGRHAVRNFVEVIAALTPEQRAAFEIERRERHEELAAHAADDCRYR